MIAPSYHHDGEDNDDATILSYMFLRRYIVGGPFLSKPEYCDGMDTG